MEGENVSVGSEVSRFDVSAKKPKTWLWILLSVILAAGISGAGIWYYMNHKLTTDKNNLQNQIDDLNKQLADLKSPTYGWKTYTNSAYGFSFKYPTTLSSIADKIPTTVQLDNSPTKNLEISGDGKMIQVWANPGGFGLEGLRDAYTASIVDSKIIVSKKEPNPDWVVGDGNSQAVLGVMQYNNLSYLIAFVYPDSKRVASLAEFDTILSTFQFTN
ncbi:MAG: hypothetical protein NTW79_00945 [Candidatus Berkelbacteria bacterium]|nr:hypothetical protein [Candidatus Berkelbacteria bacterium]